MKYLNKRILSFLLAAIMVTVTGIGGAAKSKVGDIATVTELTNEVETHTENPVTLSESKDDSTPKTGDINGDGDINAKDLTRLMKKIAGNEVEVFGADLSGDEKTNAVDLTRLMKLIAGFEIETSAPATETEPVFEPETEPVTETEAETETETEPVTESATTETEPETAYETHAPITEPVLNPDALILISDNSSDYVIVKPENAKDSESEAASELQSYMAKITGVSLPIVSDSAPAQEKEIVIGQTNREEEGFIDRQRLGKDGFIIKTDGEKLFIAGGCGYGNEHAVYELLEAYFGCRFYSVDYEKIPEKAVLGINRGTDDEQLPGFEYAEMYYCDYFHGNRTLMNKRKCGARPEYLYGARCHTFFYFISPDEFFASHPEYFGMDKSGNRQPNQLCLSNPEVLDIMTSRVKHNLELIPSEIIADGYSVSVSQMDNENPCLCEECRKIYDVEGTYSGAIIRFVNSIANSLKNEFPTVKFETLAYQYSEEPPKLVKPADNVTICLCAITACYSHPFGTCDCSGGNGFTDHLDGWKEICKEGNLVVWNYTYNWISFNTPYPDLNFQHENFAYLADHGVSSMFVEGVIDGLGYEFYELRSYLISKVLWDPYMTDDEYFGYMEEYLRDSYGDGWVYIKQYIDIVEQELDGIFKKKTARMPEVLLDLNAASDMTKPLPEALTIDMIKDYENTDWTQFYNYYYSVADCPIVTKGDSLFSLAMEGATGENKARLEKAYTQIEISRSYYLYKKVSLEEYDIGRLLSVYFTENPSGMEYEEEDALITTVQNYVTAQAKESYHEYNKDLCDRMLSMGLSAIGIGQPITGDTESLYNNPDGWK